MLRAFLDSVTDGYMWAPALFVLIFVLMPLWGWLDRCKERRSLKESERTKTRVIDRLSRHNY